MRTPSKFSIYTLVDIFEKTKKRHQYDYTNIALWNSKRSTAFRLSLQRWLYFLNIAISF